MQTTGEKPYSFAGYTLDLRQGCLHAGDRQIELRPKSFALLRYLVENAGRLVPKDELVNAIWPTVVVTDKSLTRCVSDVRLALHDSRTTHHQDRAAAGLPAGGGRVQTRAASYDAVTGSRTRRCETAPSATPPTHLQGRCPASIMIVAGAFWWWPGSPPISPSAIVVSATADKRAPPAALITAVAPSAALAKLAAQSAPRMSIVVLPFTNLSSDASQEYFADGFTEDLTTDLSRISGSFVIARTTAFAYKGKALNEKQIASELGVRYVLEGGVQKAGNQLRVNARLIDGETGAQIWAERYDRDSADMLRMQDEITNQIANALNLTLTQSESDRSWRDHPSNPDSVDLTLRANALLNGPGSPEKNTNARRLYQQAVELDPKNADAFVGLAWTYIHDVQENWVVSEIGMREAIERADDAVKQALSINPRSASAFAAKSNLLAYSMKDDYRGEIAQAIEAAETALALDPNQPKIFGWLGRLYAKAGHPERTRDFVEQAIRLNPKNDPRLTALHSRHVATADGSTMTRLSIASKGLCCSILANSYLGAG